MAEERKADNQIGKDPNGKEGKEGKDPSGKEGGQRKIGTKAVIGETEEIPLTPMARGCGTTLAMVAFEIPLT